MTPKEIEFIKNLLIKLDISIDAEHNKASGLGLSVIFDFTEEKRKQDILKALDILTLHQHEDKGE